MCKPGLLDCLLPLSWIHLEPRFACTGTRPMEALRWWINKVFILFFRCAQEQDRGWGQRKICHQMHFNISPINNCLPKGKVTKQGLGLAGSSFSEKHYFNSLICQPGIMQRLTDFIPDRMIFLYSPTSSGQKGGAGGFGETATVVMEKLLSSSPLQK